MKYSNDEILFSAINQDELHLIILPTEKCNFRCSYCYEDHYGPKMSKSTEDSIVKYIEKKIYKISYFTVDWFGGEPLLGMSTIRKINGKIVNNYVLSHQNIWFRSGMTTNGYLLKPEIFDELISLGVTQYQITLDGPKDIHNSTRKLADGKGTFDVIWNNILYMKESDKEFDVLLRLHLMKRNSNRLNELIQLIESVIKDDPRFNIFVKPIMNLGGNGAGFCEMESIWRNRKAINRIKSNLSTKRKLWEPTPICHASKLNTHIIRADGTIARCTTALKDSINSVGRIKQDGCLQLDRDKVLRWSRGIFTMDKDILYCPYGEIHNAKISA